MPTAWEDDKADKWPGFFMNDGLTEIHLTVTPCKPVPTVLGI